ncbi:T9SS type A sorting domain-containing protein [Flavobacterium sp.]|uniref:T9SS type A sorting domain-containing protein n=1 Tax=Flavobacterium sp. TaxID=239 RepID=UPI003C310CD5
MKKITLFFAMFTLMIGTSHLSAQTILNQVFNTTTYAASTANGKTAWVGNINLFQSNFESFYSYYDPGFAIGTSMSFAQNGSTLILGSPSNQNAPGETAMWFTYTATGLEVGKSYDLSALIECVQSNTGADYTAAIWEGASSAIPPAYKTQAYVNTNKKLTSTSGALGGEQTLSGTYLATASTMTFGIGAAKSTGAQTFFNKLQIKSWSIIKNTTLGINDTVLSPNNISISKTGITLNGVSGIVQVIDVLGKVLVSGSVKANEQLNYNFSSATMYFVKVSTSGGSKTRKVIFN